MKANEAAEKTGVASSEKQSATVLAYGVGMAVYVYNGGAALVAIENIAGEDWQPMVASRSNDPIGVVAAPQAERTAELEAENNKLKGECNKLEAYVKDLEAERARISEERNQLLQDDHENAYVHATKHKAVVDELDHCQKQKNDLRTLLPRVVRERDTHVFQCKELTAELADTKKAHATAVECLRVLGDKVDELNSLLCASASTREEEIGKQAAKVEDDNTELREEVQQLTAELARYKSGAAFVGAEAATTRSDEFAIYEPHWIEVAGEGVLRLNVEDKAFIQTPGNWRRYRYTGPYTAPMPDEAETNQN